MSVCVRIFFRNRALFRGALGILRHYSLKCIGSSDHLKSNRIYTPRFLGQLFFKHGITSFQSEIAFHKVTDDTLDGLSEFFDDFCDKYQLPRPDEYDVQFGDGVLTVKFGGEIGTYVINKQTPNRQIWLSSPNSGPKRYDFVDGIWVYHHTNESLHCLLSREMSQITEKEVNMRTLPFGKEWKEES